MTNKRNKRGEYGPKTDLTGQRFGRLIAQEYIKGSR